MKDKYLVDPTEPIELEPGMTCSELLTGLEKCSFQGRQLARAARVWAEALEEDLVIMMGLAGAMVPAGMRKVIVAIMEHRFIDALVATGANLYHDYFETVGHKHFMGSAKVDDVELHEAKVDRIYDTFADEKHFFDLDREIGEWTKRTIEDRPYTTREFLRLLGEAAAGKAGGEEGILSTAARLNIPVYCPAIGDSSIGIALSEMKGKKVIFDVIGDVEETAMLVTGKESMVIYVGGGTPKNFIQQTEVTNIVHNRKASGHKYAIQFVVDAPNYGGLSGCTFDEAISWGKIAVDSRRVTVLADATIALPIVTAAVLTRRRGKKRPGSSAG